MDERTKKLVLELQRGPTDLGNLVAAVSRRRQSIVAVSPRAITRWEMEAPRSWQLVREWLADYGVRLVVSEPPAAGAQG